MYLVATRNFYSISTINAKLNNEQLHREAVHKVRHSVRDCYQKIEATFRHYSERLTNQEARPANLHNDKRMSQLNRKKHEEKELLMSGIVNYDVDHAEQVKYTAKEYVPKLKRAINGKKDKFKTSQKSVHSSRLESKPKPDPRLERAERVLSILDRYESVCAISADNPREFKAELRRQLGAWVE